MEDKFDKILSNKIKEVTENSDLTYNPEHWNMLMDKKEKNKKRIIFYWQIAAFILVSLLAGGLGNYFFNSSNSPSSNTPKIIFDNKNDSLRIDSLNTNSNIFITSGPDKIDSLTKSDSKVVLIDSTTIKNKSILKSKPDLNIKEGVASTEINSKKQQVKNKNVLLPTENISEILNDSLKRNNAIATNDLIKNPNNLEQINSKEITKDSILKNNTIAIQKLKEETLIPKKDIIAALEEEKSNDESKQKPIKFGIDISPLMNYNQTNENSTIGFAGGVSVEIPISNKFDINTGVFYVDQKLDLNKSSVYLSDVVSSKSNSQLKTKEAVIKGIEIPMNIKYNFSIDKRNLFVSAGFTSTSYLKDNIEENYIINNRTATSTQDILGNNIMKYELVPTAKKVITPSNSNSFNFANILNISLGIELPIRKQQQSIIIEPYFKYLLTPVTEQNIDFSSGGIHLRYNFSFKKKN